MSILIIPKIKSFEIESFSKIVYNYSDNKWLPVNIHFKDSLIVQDMTILNSSQEFELLNDNQKLILRIEKLNILTNKLMIVELRYATLLDN